MEPVSNNFALDPPIHDRAIGKAEAVSPARLFSTMASRTKSFSEVHVAVAAPNTRDFGVNVTVARGRFCTECHLYAFSP